MKRWLSTSLSHHCFIFHFHILFPSCFVCFGSCEYRVMIQSVLEDAEGKRRKTCKGEKWGIKCLLYCGLLSDNNHISWLIRGEVHALVAVQTGLVWGSNMRLMNTLQLLRKKHIIWISNDKVVLSRCIIYAASYHTSYSVLRQRNVSDTVCEFIKKNVFERLYKGDI